MATTFYPRSIAPVTDLTLDGSFFTGASTHKALSLTRGGSAVTQTDNTVAGLSTSPTIASAAWGTASADITAGLIFITEPLDAFTLSGNITVNVRGAESNAMANYAAMAWVICVNSSGTLVFGDSGTPTLRAANGTEYGTTEAVRSITITPGASGACPTQGRLVLMIGSVSATATSSASGFTASGFYNGPTSSATGDTFVTFTETITLYSAPAAARPIRFVRQAVPRSANW